MSGTDPNRYNRPFLKWAGNKYRVLKHILPRLPAGDCLIEPFAGSCAVFLNTEFPRYVINDVNPDLIQLYRQLQKEGDAFIRYARKLFTPRNNQEKQYYRLRERFNTTTDAREKAALFLYLNRHGYNGLCRYNRSHRFNVPFGRYKRPYFPEKEMRLFHAKAQRAEFVCRDFRQIIAEATPGCAIYADPPYIPLNTTASFTQYSSAAFDLEGQKELAACAAAAAARGVPVVISNHDTPFARRIYRDAELVLFKVKRSISCNGQRRNEVPELLALYAAD